MTKEEFEKRAVRHGDVVLIPVDEIPAGAKEIYHGPEYIVSHSATGHHHVAVGDVTIFKPAGAGSADLFMRVNDSTRIEHRKTSDRHEAMPILKGDYLIGAKRQYDYFANVIVPVSD